MPTKTPTKKKKRILFEHRSWDKPVCAYEGKLGTSVDDISFKTVTKFIVITTTNLSTPFPGAALDFDDYKRLVEDDSIEVTTRRSTWSRKRYGLL